MEQVYRQLIVAWGREVFRQHIDASTGGIVVRTTRARRGRRLLPAGAVAILSVLTTLPVLSTTAAATSKQPQPAPVVNGVYRGPQPTDTEMTEAEMSAYESKFLAYIADNPQLSEEQLGIELNRRYGLVVVSTPADGLQSTDSDADDAKASRPKVYWSFYTSRWYIHARWDWYSKNWKADTKYGDEPADVGGPDGFGIKWEPRRIYNRKVYTLACWNEEAAWDCKSHSLDENTLRGVTMRGQDKGFEHWDAGAFYSWDYGWMTIRLTKRPIKCGKKVFITGGLFHSWSDTHLTSLGISVGANYNVGFSASWKNEGHNWKLVSQGEVWKRPCS